jgi:FtsP/CotA-like multicopper oxidase with cupredoxin domain
MGDIYTPVDVSPYLKGKPKPADPNERGWKDTFRMNPGEVSRILVRFAPQDESDEFEFDATAEPGYVWHCHILEHEEHDMMRPLVVS